MNSFNKLFFYTFLLCGFFLMACGEQEESDTTPGQDTFRLIRSAETNPGSTPSSEVSTATYSAQGFATLTSDQGNSIVHNGSSVVFTSSDSSEFSYTLDDNFFITSSTSNGANGSPLNSSTYTREFDSQGRMTTETVNFSDGTDLSISITNFTYAGSNPNPVSVDQFTQDPDTGVREKLGERILQFDDLGRLTSDTYFAEGVSDPFFQVTVTYQLTDSILTVTQTEQPLGGVDPASTTVSTYERGLCNSYAIQSTNYRHDPLCRVNPTQ